MRAIGLKLWSTNQHYVEEAKRLVAAGLCQYIELYIVPRSLETSLNLWMDLRETIPFVIHAPHFKEGMNLALKEKDESNQVRIKETRQFADALCADTIIYHPGIAGDIHETARQVMAMKDSRVVLENKPYYTQVGEGICNGYSPEDIGYVMNEAGVGCCLDFGHAICAANALNESPLAFIDRFNALSPTLYHLTDGHFAGTMDAHLHFGQGSFPLQELLRRVPEGARVTNEAVKDSADNLADVDADIMALRAYL